MQRAIRPTVQSVLAVRRDLASLEMAHAAKAAGTAKTHEKRARISNVVSIVQHSARTASKQPLLSCGAHLETAATRRLSLGGRSLEEPIENQHDDRSKQNSDDQRLPPRQVAVAPPVIVCGLLHGLAAIWPRPYGQCPRLLADLTEKRRPA